MAKINTIKKVASRKGNNEAEEEINALNKELKHDETVTETFTPTNGDNVEQPVEEEHKAKEVPTKVKYQPKALKEALDKYPQSTVELYMILHSNTEIRRFCSLGIINFLLQKKAISGNKRYVEFLPNKFSVICDGLRTEFRYTEPFFLNALVASFSSFANNATKIITTFMKDNLIDNSLVNNDTVKEFQNA